LIFVEIFYSEFELLDIVLKHATYHLESLS
jgi:hypothetical protein